MYCYECSQAGARGEHHYLPPSERVECPTPIGRFLVSEFQALSVVVREGLVWTTDPPYRETATPLRHWAEQGVLAVEMQAASLFAFAKARAANIAVVARVSNAVDHQGEQFDTGTNQEGLSIIKGIVRAGEQFLRVSGAA